MSTNFGIQSLQSAFQKNVSDWTELTRRRVSSHLSAVRRRWPPCQLPRHPQVATHRVDASDATSIRSERSISLRHCHSELRRATASFSGCSTAPPAKPARQKLCQSFLYLGVTSSATVEHR